jgi:polyisoprenoid-binding protein YceI
VTYSWFHKHALGSVIVGLALLATPALAAPATWTVDPSSKLTFSGAMNGAGFTGTFKRWSAQIAFDPKALAASKVVVSIDVASAASGDADRDQAMPTSDWFASAKFAKATFVSRAFKDLGGGKYEADGDLTLRGVTKPVALPFTLAIAGDTARMNGAVVLNRTAFGVGQGQWKTGEVVDTKVTVNVALTAHRAH